MKTMEETPRSTDAAKPMELACATVDMMAIAIRAAVEANDEQCLAQALGCLANTTKMMQGWLTDALPKAYPRPAGLEPSRSG